MSRIFKLLLLPYILTGLSLIIVLLFVLNSRNNNDRTGCENSEYGFASVSFNVSIDQRYFYLVANNNTHFTGQQLTTSENTNFTISLSAGFYSLDMYYVTGNEYDSLENLEDITSIRDPDYTTEVRLCSGDEFNVLAWDRGNIIF